MRIRTVFYQTIPHAPYLAITVFDNRPDTASLKPFITEVKILFVFFFMPRHKKWRAIMLYPPNF